MSTRLAYSIFLCSIPLVAVILGTVLGSDVLVGGGFGFAVGAAVVLGYALVVLDEIERKL